MFHLKNNNSKQQQQEFNITKTNSFSSFEEKEKQQRNLK